MLKFLGEEYFIDIERLEDITRINDHNTTDNTGKTENQVSIVKFDAIKMMLEVIMTEDQEMDDNLKITKVDDLTIPFILSFNTLLTHKIIKYY